MRFHNVVFVSFLITNLSKLTLHIDIGTLYLAAVELSDLQMVGETSSESHTDIEVSFTHSDSQSNLAYRLLFFKDTADLQISSHRDNAQ